MATGRLGVSAISAATLTTIYTVPTGTYTVCNVSITNRNAGSVKVRLAMATTATPNVQDYIEYDSNIRKSTESPGEKIVTWSALPFPQTDQIGCPRRRRPGFRLAVDANSDCSAGCSARPPPESGVCPRSTCSRCLPNTGGCSGPGRRLAGCCCGVGACPGATPKW